MTVINAFHPDYIKTYYPDFTREFRTVEANQKERLAIHGKVKPKKKKPKPKMNYKIPKQVIKPKNEKLEQPKRNILDMKTFHTFAKAGLPRGVKNGTDT